MTDCGFLGVVKWLSLDETDVASGSESLRLVVR